MQQPDLFAPEADSADLPSVERLAAIREKLHASLALVTSAQTMPWADQLAMIHADNEFRFAKDKLPADEGAALWAAFDREMDRLYAKLRDEVNGRLDAADAAQTAERI